MKTTSMTLYIAMELGVLKKGAVVMVTGLECINGLHRVHEAAQSTNPRQYNCKLEREGVYHKRDLDTAQIVTVITGG